MNAKKIIMFSFISIVFINFLIFALPVDSHSKEILVNSGHPRILVTQDDIGKLRDKAATSHLDTYSVIKDWCDENWNNTSVRKALLGGDFKYDAGVLRYALIYLIGEVSGFSYVAHNISDYGDMAVAILREWAGESGFASWKKIVPMAIAYDWVHDRLSTSDKTMIVNFFTSHPYNGMSPQLSDDKGYRFPQTPYCLYPGLAFYGDGIDDEKAEIYLNFILTTWMDDIKCVVHMSGEDGGHNYGPGYTKYGPGAGWHLAQDFYALITATSLTIDSTFNEYHYMNGYSDWFLHATMPGPPSPAYGADSSHVATLNKTEDMMSIQWNVTTNEYPFIQALRIMTRVAQDEGNNAKAQLITWLANVRYKVPKISSTWDIIFNDRSISPKSPSELGEKRCKAFGWNELEGKVPSYDIRSKSGLGQVYMRSSWDQEAGTTYAFFKAFPYYYGGHQHTDSLSFSIFKGEQLALQNSGAYFYWYEGARIDNPHNSAVGYPHHWYYYERTVGHNSLLIMDPGEKIRARSTYFDPIEQIYKDGGQRVGSYDAGGQWGSVEDGPSADPAGGRDWGGLIKHEDTDDYTYSSGDATKGYNSIVDGENYVSLNANPKVKLVQRDFTYLKSNSDGENDYFVVFDRIKSTDPSFRKVFLLHTIGEPKLNGNPSQIYGDSEGGLRVSTDTDYISITQDTGKLFMKTLLPHKTFVYKMGGYTDTVLSTEINKNDGDGGAFGGNKIDIKVNSAERFPDKPVVTIDNGVSKECFMCDGKTDTSLTGCIRGKRYYKYNFPLTHSTGSVVTQDYAWMIREADTGEWISYPHDFGQPHTNPDKVNDVDEYGRWTLRVETATDESYSNFLHVFHPTVNMEKTSMSETVLIEAGSMAGSLIKDPINQWVVLFSKLGDLQENLAYTANYSENCKHLITGLKFAVYDVYKNDIKILTKQSSNQNTLSFESTEGGVFLITKSGEVPNYPPSASVTADPMTDDAPLTVDFTGTGRDSDGTVVSYLWNFGDGASSNEQNPRYIFRNPGNYTATFTVTDDRGAASTTAVTILVTGAESVPSPTSILGAPTGLRILPSPTASFSVDPKSGTAPLNVNFTGSATDTNGTIVAYTWDFGDGSNSSEQNPVHTFNSPGSYTVSLTVTYNDGATGAANTRIDVLSGDVGNENKSPSASITADPTSGDPPLSVSFTGTGADSDGSIVSFLWNFGDGTTSNQQNASHTYTEAGYYTAFLTVTDNDGATGTSSIRIASGSPSFPYVFNDFNFYPVPESPRPEKGVPFRDPNFHTLITRITNSPTDAPGSTYDYAQTGYPKHNIENSNGTKLIIQSLSYPNWHIWDANPPYNKIRDIPPAIVGGTDPVIRWDNSDPDILYTSKGSKFYKWNINSDFTKAIELYDFQNYFPNDPIAFITQYEEGDGSDDRRYWPFFIRCYDPNQDPTWYTVALVVYDKDKNGTDNGDVISTLSPDSENWIGAGGGFCKMSPDGNYVWVGDSHRIYPRDLSDVWWLDGGDPTKTMSYLYGGHADITYDDQGNQVIVVGKSRSGVYGDKMWMVMVDIVTGERTWLAEFHNGGFHISANAHETPGWAVVSTYYPSYPDTANDWTEHSVIMLELTQRTDPPPKVWRVANTQTVRKDYADDPFAKINMKGTKIWFGSGWGQSRRDGQYDVYQIDLPANWYQDLQ